MTHHHCKCSYKKFIYVLYSAATLQAKLSLCSIKTTEILDFSLKKTVSDDITT